MKKLMLTVCLVLGLIIMTAPMAMADTLLQIGYKDINNVVSSYGRYQTGQGGEFTLNPLGGWVDLNLYNANTKNVGVGGTFQSFCVEGGETISGYPAKYTAVLNSNAVYGGVDSGGDRLSVGAAWLYSEFATGGTFGGHTSYNYAGGRTTTAGLLQNAIWWLEEEKGITYNPSNQFMSAVVSQFGSEAKAKANYTPGQYNVWVLNLYDTNRNRAQDQLVLHVPEPGILILLGIAMSAIGAASWRLRKL